MKCFVILLICSLLLTGCQNRTEPVAQKPNVPPTNEIGKEIVQTNVKFDSGNPNIGINSYTLISDNAEKQRADAEAIMQVKKNFPLAVQTKDHALFERILARDFIFRGEMGIMRRDEYIKDRTSSLGKVLTADYENIALQFFGDIAVMTYRNIVKGTDEKGAPDPPEYISWMDVYVKENSEWKIGSVHVIDYRTENVP
jgi:ketosteroid isomerase-like protein